MGFYQPLFTVSVDHMYFSDGLWKGLNFVPCAGTLKVINGSSMVLKQTKNGIGVYFDEDKSEVLRLYAEDTEGALRFSFKVYAKDRMFANYTEPPSRKHNTILCFGNRDANEDAESGKISLSKDDFASEKDLQDMDTLIAEDILCVKDKRMSPDFVVNIFAKPTSNGDWNAQDFGIKFNTRQSFWKYHLLGNMNRNNSFIVDLDNRFEFEFCGEVMLQGDKPAKVFRSKELIPVLERSNYRFQLREPGQGSGKVLIKRLPVASESSLGMEVINGKSEIVSESYINY